MGLDGAKWPRVSRDLRRKEEQVRDGDSVCLGGRGEGVREEG